jgi:hypothetical protein
MAELNIISIEECEAKITELSGEDNPVPELLYLCTNALPPVHLGDVNIYNLYLKNYTFLIFY